MRLVSIYFFPDAMNIVLSLAYRQSMDIVAAATTTTTTTTIVAAVI